LGIARALMKDAPIIVLDEATWALDTEAELEIQRALGAVMQGRTVLAIAHRLSTLAKFDRLVVLCERRIVEQGTRRPNRAGGTGCSTGCAACKRKGPCGWPADDRDHSA
jgi:ABC-type transport system involved in Fe-S cluster assembly fused permease/ATPase subunit